MTARFFCQLEYDGSSYKGFQAQKSTKKTIQYEVEHALAKVADHEINIVCSGRTDAGVHAVNQIFHFDTTAERDIDSWIRGANANLPNNISLINFFNVETDSHARFDAISREYIYLITNSDFKPAIHNNKTLWVRRELDVKGMNDAAKLLIGEKDFSSFRATGCQSKHSVRKIYEAEVRQDNDLISFRIKANAFMLNMVRIIVGTLLAVGCNEKSLSDFANIIEAKDRKRSGKTVDPFGLYFMGLEYNYLSYKKNRIFK